MIQDDNLFGTPHEQAGGFFGIKLHKRIQMRTFCSVMRLLLILLAFLSGLTQAAGVVSHPYKGVTYISRREISPLAVNMHIVLIDLAEQGISFKLTPPGGTHDTVRNTTLDFLNQQHAQVAINCHFFLPFPSTDINSDVVGLAASQGNVYSPFEPQPVTAGYTDQSFAIIACAPALNIDANNHACIVNRDPAYSDNKHILEPVTLWNAVSGSAQIITNGVKTIPKYSGPPPVLNPIKGFSDSNSWYSLRKPRTVIGLSRSNKTLVFFTVDGAGGSAGMTCGQVADLLVSEYGVYNALNLDGGGSTTLAMEDPKTHAGKIINVSSANHNGRAVGSSLAVFADENGPGTFNSPP
jgi:hypothetical protein